MCLKLEDTEKEAPKWQMCEQKTIRTTWFRNNNNYNNNYDNINKTSRCGRQNIVVNAKCIKMTRPVSKVLLAEALPKHCLVNNYYLKREREKKTSMKRTGGTKTKSAVAAKRKKQNWTTRTEVNEHKVERETESGTDRIKQHNKVNK